MPQRLLQISRLAQHKEVHCCGHCRIKCFYLGYPYGLSFESQAFKSRSSLTKALQDALSEEYSVCSSDEMEMFAYDKEVGLSPHMASNPFICREVADLSQKSSTTIDHLKAQASLLRIA